MPAGDEGYGWTFADCDEESRVKTVLARYGGMFKNDQRPMLVKVAQDAEDWFGVTSALDAMIAADKARAEIASREAAILAAKVKVQKENSPYLMAEPHEISWAEFTARNGVTRSEELTVPVPAYTMIRRSNGGASPCRGGEMVMGMTITDASPVTDEQGRIKYYAKVLWR